MKRLPTLTKRERKASRSVPEGERITMCWRGRDITVPYVAVWTSEQPNFRVAPDPMVKGRPALFRGSGKRGVGSPVLGKMDPARQRICVIRGLCQVCAKPLEGNGWFALFMEQVSLVDGREAVAVREPAACAECMALSVAVCPGLKRGSPLIVQARKRTLLMTLTVPPIGGFGPLTEDGPELKGATLEKTVVGYMKVVLGDLSASYSLSDFAKAFDDGKVS
jgi:hypothetical protein